MEILTPLKRLARIMLRKMKDVKERTVFCKKREILHLPYSISLTQPILPSDSFAEKQYNLNHIAKQIGQYTIKPCETLSFWKVVGNPSKLKNSRCIRNNKVSMEKGGGLCQAAGIIYHLALVSGLKIAERHHHSLDLYGDGPRTCPIGLDATVCYGYKDLRIYNHTGAVMRFDLAVLNDELRAELHSDTPLDILEIMSERHDSSGTIEVSTYYAHNGELIANNIYKTMA